MEIEIKTKKLSQISRFSTRGAAGESLEVAANRLHQGNACAIGRHVVATGHAE